MLSHHAAEYVSLFRPTRAENLLDIPVNTAPLPEVTNHTAFPSQYFQMLDVSDQVFHVVVCRQTYNLCQVDDEGRVVLADVQTPLVATDQFYREINASSLIQESDFAPYKPKCDILFAYTYAHAPEGKASARWQAGIQIDEWQKHFRVTGTRKLWRASGGWQLTEPEPVTQVPICYENAYGGAWTDAENVTHQDERNPLGVGYFDSLWLDKQGIKEIPAPQLEMFERPFTEQTLNYPVVGLSAIGRGWLPRRLSAGTYDDEWKKQRWPHLPTDFDFAYWNSAPEDQQIAYPKGGEEVVLTHLHQKAVVKFRLPLFPVKLRLHLNVGIPLFKPMAVDTLLFDMKNLQLIVVQRALVATSTGVDSIEIGTWDSEVAHAKNAAILRKQLGENDGR
jgi:hypothetical protein